MNRVGYHRKEGVYISSLTGPTCATNTNSHDGICRRLVGRVKTINICDVFRQMSSNVTVSPKAGAWFFCVVGREGWAFSKTYRGTFATYLDAQNWPKDSKMPEKPLVFSVTDTEILSRIRHKAYRHES